MSDDRINEFSTVPAFCTACGWFRVLGYTGCKNGNRALIRIVSDPAECNVLRGRVIEQPAELPPEEWPEGYRDLSEESHRSEMVAIERTLEPLLARRVCPRCKQATGLRINSYTMLGGDPLIAKLRT
jgi:hypothetical protein